MTTMTREPVDTLDAGPSPAPPAAEADTDKVQACFVAPRHRADPDWLWVTHVEPMSDRFDTERVYIDNTFEPFPKLTRFHVRWQYYQAIRRMSAADLAWIFSTDVAAGVTGWMSRGRSMPPRIYVGFTQDGHWPQQRIRESAAALQKCDAVTMFSAEESKVIIPRYGLDPDRVHIVPISTDETGGYRQYPDRSPRADQYVLSLGSPNRRFMGLARVCRDLGVPLVIITRPWHENDSLDELAEMGVEVITDADKMKALTYLKHARLAAMAFDDPTIPGGFTTLVHAMFMGTPFVCTDCLGMAEHVIHDETGFVTPHDDQAALRDAIERLWNEPGLAERFGDSAHRRAQQRHSIEAAARMFHDLALHVLSRRPSFA